MPRKLFTLLERPKLLQGLVMVLNRQPLPNGECRVWGKTPRFWVSGTRAFLVRSFVRSGIFLSFK
jgi:hypothetical protein